MRNLLLLKIIAAPLSILVLSSIACGSATPEGLPPQATAPSEATSIPSTSDSHCPPAAAEALASGFGRAVTKSDTLIQGSSAGTASLVAQEHAKIIEEFAALDVPPCMKAIRDESLLFFKSRQNAVEYAASGDWTNNQKAWNEANSHLDRARALLDEAIACAQGTGPCP